MQRKVKVLIAGSIAIALITVAIGGYLYVIRTPSVTFTSVNFDVNYEGNQSNFLIPSIGMMTGTEGYNDSEITNVTPYKGVDNSWFIWVTLQLQYNSSSRFGDSVLNNGFGPNNSAVLESLHVDTSGFSYGKNGISMGDLRSLPMPLVPGYSSNIQLEVQVGTYRYDGPLNFSINVSSPAENIAIYRPSVSVVAASNQSSPVSLDVESYYGESLADNSYVVMGNQSFLQSVGLNSVSNFTISKVTVNSPFAVSNISYGVATRAETTNSTGTYFFGPYILSVEISIMAPTGPFEQDLDITIYTGNA